jgi:hypothetical protein
MTTDKEDQPATAPRRFIDHRLTDDPTLHDFDSHDKAAVYQITQQLTFLGEEKATRLVKFLDSKPLFRV